MKKEIIIFVVVSFIVVSVGMVRAQDWPKGSRVGYGPNPDIPHPQDPRLWICLNLTTEQLQKMQFLWDKHFKEMAPLRNEVMSKELELRALWLKTDFDEEKILAKQKKISLLKAQIDEKATRNRLEIHQVLTPEQRAKLAEPPPRPPDFREDAKGYGFGHGPWARPGHGAGMGFAPR